MPAYRVSALPTTALLLLALGSPAIAEPRPVVLDGGKAWALHDAKGIVPLPAPPSEVFLHKAVTTDSGPLVAGVERVADGTAAERLALFQGGSETLHRLPVPKQEHSAVVYGPTPLIDRGALTGMLWIEGFAPDRTRVRAADWTGSGWSQPVSVSDFGAGTQIALDVVDLADGSRLAVWAAFDGEDDEIVWSRHTAGEWSRPRPLTANRVPDVTPTLLATGGSALVAWSGYDGNDYRIQVARLEGDAWTEPSLLEGRGGVWPIFEPLGDGGVLTWRQAAPSTWMVASVGAGEIAWTRAVAPPKATAHLAARPLASLAAGSLRLLWPVAGADQPVLAETVVQAPTD